MFLLLPVNLLSLLLLLWQEAPAADDTSLVGLVFRASPVARLILLLLLGLSIASWAIIFNKWKATRRARELSSIFIDSFNNSKSWAELSVNTASLLDNPIKAIFLAAQFELQRQKTVSYTHLTLPTKA